MEWPGWWSSDAAVELVEASGPGTGWLVLAYLLLVGPVYLCLAHRALPGEGAARRRLWCPASGRDVEVEFRTRGVPGLRRAVGVNRCSAFEPASDIHCDRRCVARDYRLLAAGPFPVKLSD